MPKKQTKRVDFLVKISLFASRWAKTIIGVWLLVLVVSLVIYAKMIAREDFPAIAVPMNFIVANNSVADARLIDSSLARPITEAVLQLDKVEKIQTTATDNQLQAVVFFEAGTISSEAQSEVELAVEEANLPKTAEVHVQDVNLIGYLDRYDLLVGVWGSDFKSSKAELQSKAETISNSWRAKYPDKLKTAEVISLTNIDSSGQSQSIGFNHLTSNPDIIARSAILIGVNRQEAEIDLLSLSNFIQTIIDQESDQSMAIVADKASSINSQIGSLQSNLILGLVIIGFISLICLSFRSALIAAAFMVTVILLSTTVLYLLGSSLNTVSLFCLVLALGLFVDDAIIVVESLELFGRKKKRSSYLSIIQAAVSRIVRPSWAGTLTTILVFVPFLFVEGVLGQVIKIIPLTIVIPLLISFILSISLIPALATVLLKKKTTGSTIQQVVFDKLAKIASSVPAQLASTKQSVVRRGRRLMVGLIVGASLIMVGSIMLRSKITFNIFPPLDDGIFIAYQFDFPNHYNLDEVEAQSESIMLTAAQTIGPDNLKRIVYDQASPTNQQIQATIYLTPTTARDITSSELADRLIGSFLSYHSQFRFLVYTVGVGPSLVEYPLRFTVDSTAEVDLFAQGVVNDLRLYLDETEFDVSGEKIRIYQTKLIGNERLIKRTNGQRNLVVAAKFHPNQVITSGLLQTISNQVVSEFGPTGLVSQDLGQEADNAKAFNSLVYIAPIVLLGIYILLAIQFRSLTQPILMLSVLPFVIPGISLYLVLTGTPLSFFVMMGFISLIGIAINNTILLTDYANSHKSSGKSAAEAIKMAIRARFRPLVMTTITTLVALLPLMFSEPFWEPLAGTIIAGLISSTLMTIMLFPIIYLFIDWLNRKATQIIDGYESSQ